MDGPVRYWDDLTSVQEMFTPGWEAAEKGSPKCLVWNEQTSRNWC